MSAKLFVLYDGRARGGDTDPAAVLVSASSRESAILDCEHFKGYDAVWYEYDITNREMLNERLCVELNRLLEQRRGSA